MSGLTIGEITGIIDLQDEGFGRVIQTSEDGIRRLESTVNSATSGLASDAAAAFGRMDSSFGSALTDMQAEADAGAAKLVDEILHMLGTLDDEAQADGKRAGDALVDGLKQGLDGAKEAARGAGEDAGRGLGDGTEDAGKGRMSGVASGLMGALKAAPWLAAGAAIGAIFMAGLQGAMEKQDAVALLGAQVGAFGPRSAELGKVAGQVYADAYGESMGDVTDAIKSVIQNISGMDDAGATTLKGVTEGAMTVAQIMGEEVGPVTNAVSQMLRTGLAKNAQEAFDILVKGTQKGVNKSEDLLDTFNEYSTKFRDIGLDGQTAMGLLSQGLQGGARDADTVADALKEFAIRARDGSDTSVAAFEKIGLNGDKMTAVFAKGGPGAAKALDLVIGKIQAIKDPVERNAVGVSLFGTKFEDLGASFMSLDPSKAAASLGTVGDAAATAGQKLSDTASNKIEAFKRGLQQGVVDFIGGTVLPGLEKLGEGFSFSGAQEKLSELGGKVAEIWNSITETVRQWLADNQGTVNEWISTFKEGWNTISEVVSEVLDLVKELWAKYGEDIMSVLGILVSTFMGVWSGLWTTIKGIFQVFAGLLTGDMTKLKEGLRAIWDGLWKIVESILQGALGILKKAWDSIVDTATKTWEDLKKVVVQKTGDLITFVKQLPGKILDALSKLGSLLISVGRDLIQGLIDGISDMVGKLGDKLGDITQFIKDNKGPIEKDRVLLKPAGNAIMDGLMAGMTERMPVLERQLDSITATLKKKVAEAVEVLSGNEMSGVFNAGSAADGEIAKLLGGAKFGLDVQALKPDPIPDPPPKPKPKPKPRSDPNDVTIDRGPKRDPNDVTIDRGPRRDPNDVTIDRGPRKPKDPAGYVQPSAASVHVEMHGTTVREDADIDRLGAQFGLQYSARGNI